MNLLDYFIDFKGAAVMILISTNKVYSGNCRLARLVTWSAEDGDDGEAVHFWQEAGVRFSYYAVICSSAHHQRTKDLQINQSDNG